MWKILIYVSIGYLILTLITKIVDKRQVKKYGRNITINRANNGNNEPINDGNGITDTDKQ